MYALGRHMRRRWCIAFSQHHSTGRYKKGPEENFEPTVFVCRFTRHIPPISLWLVFIPQNSIGFNSAFPATLHFEWVIESNLSTHVWFYIMCAHELLFVIKLIGKLLNRLGFLFILKKKNLSILLCFHGFY